MLAQKIRKGAFLTGLLVLYISNVFAAYTFTGPQSVNGGQTYTYTISPSLANGNVFGTSGAAAVVSTTSNSITITWGCTASGSIYITATGHLVASYTVSITTSSPLTSGNITPASQTINYAAVPTSLTGAVPLGGDCSASLGYQWYYSTDGSNYSTISGAINANYAPGGLTNPVNYYKRIATKGTQSLTTTAVVNVYAQVGAGSISPASQTINYGANAGAITVSGMSGGNSSYSYQWEWCSTSNGTYTPINGATNASYTPTGLTATTYYKVIVSSNGAPATTGTPATVNVYGQVTTGTISPASITIPYNTSPGPLTCSPGGGNGTYSYIWYYSTDNNTYYTVSGAAGQSYTPGALLNTIYYKVKVTSNGASATSAFAVVTVPHTFGVAAATNQTGNANNNMNWRVVTAYDASGNVLRQRKDFYDQLGKLLQAQQKVFYRQDAQTVYNHVMASQPIRDADGRQVLSTKWAPIDYADFSYASGFAQAADGSAYTYKNFDQFNPSGTQTDKTLSPDAMGGQSTKGTLGWYYSPNNNWEPYLPTTGFPFDRQTYYSDGTGNVKKVGFAGETMRVGAGHEISAYHVPVNHELDDYVRVRNYFFTTADLGVMPTSLQYNAIEEVDHDENGNEQIRVTDLNGHTLMTARPGSDLTPALNTVTLSALPYSLTVPATPSGSGCSFGSSWVKFYGNGTSFTLTNPANMTLTMTGPLRGDSAVFTATDWGTVIHSDAPFSVVYSDKQTSSCTLVNTQLSSQTSAAALQEYYFKILADNSVVNITGNFTLYDMSTETTTTLSGAGTLNRGFYRVIANSGTVTLSYGNSFTDVAYYYYNELGQLVASVAPEGVKKMYGTGINSYASRAAAPYWTGYTYDMQGRLASVQDPDGGTRQFQFRKDGQIRFSQTAVQAATSAYSYTNYDQQGRIVESGQYTPGTGGVSFSSTSSILENVSAGGGLVNGTKTDVVITQYDASDNSYGLSGYTQDAANLIGRVSATWRYSVVSGTPSSSNLVSATWYNYDENGNTIWKIKYASGLGYKTWDYVYDALGRLTTRTFQAGTAPETFIHYYDYDAANGNLWHISTGTVVGGSKTLQATYIRNLRGGLQRMELGTNLQGVDYTYNLQNNLKAINNSNKSADPSGDGTSNNFAPDAFGEVVDYYSGDYTNSRTNVSTINSLSATGIPDDFTGNVKASSWFSEKPTSSGLTDAPHVYFYQYDPKDEFTESTWGNVSFSGSTPVITTTGYNKEKLGNATAGLAPYDGNGNIQYLQRTDGAGNATDQFTYHYSNGNNQLTSVTGATQTFATYGYDGEGQVISVVPGDGSAAKYMTYDVMGRVTAVYRDAAHSASQLVVSYVYDEGGSRLKKLDYTSGVLTSVTYYIGDVVYTQQVTNSGTVYQPAAATEYQVSGGNGRIGIFFPTLVAGGLYTYELRDHVGNVRAVIAATASSSYTVQNSADYYPFGGIIAGVINGYRYGFEGDNAEADGETGWNAFELRMYDTRTGRWMQYDPKGQFFSPYVGIGNNPVSASDDDGGGVGDGDGDCTGCMTPAFVFGGVMPSSIFSGIYRAARALKRAFEYTQKFVHALYDATEVTQKYTAKFKWEEVEVKVLGKGVKVGVTPLSLEWDPVKKKLKYKMFDVDAAIVGTSKYNLGISGSLDEGTFGEDMDLFTGAVTVAKGDGSKLSYGGTVLHWDYDDDAKSAMFTKYSATYTQKVNDYLEFSGQVGDENKIKAKATLGFVQLGVSFDVAKFSQDMMQ